MNLTQSEGAFEAFRTLRRMLPRAETAERCELCGQNVATQHEHLLDPRTGRLRCSCQACALLFSGSATQQYKRVPRQIRSLRDCSIDDADWDALAIPIGIAFFVRHSINPRVAAYYPSPAGPVESLLSLDAWREVAAANPVLDGMEADTEALLVNRAAQGYFILPIDECYRLTGLMRAHWKGLSGGAEVWREIQLFFEEMKNRAVEASASHA